MIAASKAAHEARRYGWLSSNDNDNNNNILRNICAQLRANQQQIYDHDDSPEALKKLGIQVVLGRAVMESPTTVRVVQNNNDNSNNNNNIRITARLGIVLCTGAQAAVPTNSISGLDQMNIGNNNNNQYWTYENVWEQLEQQPSLPKRLVVLGGGPIGCELAQALSRLGCQKVTIVTSDRLLPREDPAVTQVLTQVFENEGIAIVSGRATSVRRDDNNGDIVVQVQCGDNTTTTTIVADQLLVATGRVPRVQGMNLEGVGIQLTPDGTAIAVNDRLQTTVRNVYAAGDCTGGRQFTHLAGYQGAIAVRNIVLPLSDPGVLATVPATTFTSPEVASVGLSEAAAKKKYGANKIVVAEQSLSRVDRAVCDNQQLGLIKIVYLKKNGRVLGSTIVAPVAGELISEMAVVIQTGLPFQQLATIMHPYPSYAIALQLMAADAYYKKTLKMKWLLDILKKLGL